MNKSSRYLLQIYYVSSTKSAHLVELLRIPTLHIIMSVVNTFTTTTATFLGFRKCFSLRNYMRFTKMRKCVQFCTVCFEHDTFWLGFADFVVAQTTKFHMLYEPSSLGLGG